jgi:hypothetical protein
VRPRAPTVEPMVDSAPVEAPPHEGAGVRLFGRNLGPVLVLSLLAHLPTMVALVLFIARVLPYSTVVRHQETAQLMTLQGWFFAAGLIAPGAGKLRGQRLPWRDWLAAAGTGAVRSLVASLAVTAVAAVTLRVHGALTAAVCLVLVLLPAVAAVERPTAVGALRRSVGLALSHLGSIILRGLGFLFGGGLVAMALSAGGRGLVHGVSAEAFWTVFSIVLAVAFLLTTALQAAFGCLVAAGYHAWRGPLPAGDVARVFD